MTRVSKCALWGLPRRPGLTECHPPLLRAHEQSLCTGGISYCGAGKNDKGVEQPASPAHQAESGGRKLHSRSERERRDISSPHLSRATPTPWNSTLMGLRLCPPAPGHDIRKVLLWPHLKCTLGSVGSRRSTHFPAQRGPGSLSQGPFSQRRPVMPLV